MLRVFYCGKGTGILNREICAGKSTGAVREKASSFPTTDDFCSAAIQRGTGPRATGLAAVMEAVQTGITGMMFVYCSLSSHFLVNGAFVAAVVTI